MRATPSLAFVPVIASLLAGGCGGGSNPSTDEVYPLLTGYFLDSPVGNVEYRTATRQGFTGTDGAFGYLAGERVTFVIGPVMLPATPGRDAITPVQIFGSADDRTNNRINRPAFNLATLLLSLDQDSDPANGIFVSDGTRAALLASGLEDLDFDVLAEDFAATIAPAIAASSTATGQVPATTVVLQHLATSLGATSADSDADGLYDFEDPLPFDPDNGGPVEPAQCLLDSNGLQTLGQAEATVSFDREKWAAAGLTQNSFIGAEGNGLLVGPVDGEDLLDVPAPSEFDPDLAFLHTMNSPGAVYADATRRTQVPVPFLYDATNSATLLATASGRIGLAGVSRWTVSPDRGGGQLLFGDYDLFYNGASGTWELVNRIDFPLTTFTLGNAVLTTGAGQDFTLSGDLIGSVALNILLAGGLGEDFGDFRLEGRCQLAAAAP
ncbi:MAG: hypothetical protein ABL989_03685 [Gammaproteobacteria bacterium]